MENGTPLTHILMALVFLTNVFGPLPVAQAQDYHLPVPGVMVHLSPPLNPPILKGIKVHTDNSFRFDFLLDEGDSQFNSNQIKEESSKLIKYFLASLTIPEKDLWVNLSPYEKDRIIPQSFGLTEMGRDLLAEDYMLKQITASLIYPEGEVGKRFWKRIYEKAEKKYGTTSIPVNTFNKVWIVPEKATVYENAEAGTAYIIESRLKVMLEQDYLSLEKHLGIQSKVSQSEDTNQLGSQIVREIVIPELTKEVNEDKNFTRLRQVYNSLILATWYKKKIKDSILSQVYADKNKTAGVQYTSTVIPAKAGIHFKNDVEGLYQEYLKAFKKGVYNYIKEEQDPVTQEVIPRKYFSGGVNATLLWDTAMTTVDSRSALGRIIGRSLTTALVGLFLFTISVQVKGQTVPVQQDNVKIEASVNSPTISIVGMQHKSQQDDDFQRNLIFQASQGKIVLGIESLVRDDAKERYFIKSVYGVEKGLAFGFEDDFANYYVDFLFDYPEIANGKIKENPIKKLKLVESVKESPSVADAWKKLGEEKLSDSTRKLYDQISAYVDKNSNLSSEDFVQQLVKSLLDKAGSDTDWEELYKRLILIMTATTNNFSPGLRVDTKQIQAYFNNPNGGAEKYYVIFEIAIKWRNVFILKHMKEIADIAKQKKLNAYFLIGDSHLFDLKPSLGSGYNGMPVTFFNGTDFVPRQGVLLGVPSTSPSKPQKTTTHEPRRNQSMSFIAIYDKGPDAKQSAELQGTLVQLASQGKIVLGITGVIRGKEGAYKGNVYGIEDDFANKYANTLIAYGIIVNDIADMIPTKKIELVDAVWESPALSLAWKQLGGRKLSKPTRVLYEQISSFVEKNKDLDKKDFVQKLNESLPQFGSNSDWQDLLKNLILVMTETANGFQVELRPDTGKIQAYLNNPIEKTTVLYIVNEIDDKWKKKFVEQNMRSISDVAIQKGLNVYFLLDGPRDTSDFGEALIGNEGSYRGLRSKFYAAPSLVKEHDDIPESNKQGTSKKDGAMLYGGIDLTITNMNLQTQNAGEEIKFILDPAMLEQLKNASGFVPVIIHIQPLRDLQIFLGLKKDSPSVVS